MMLQGILLVVDNAQRETIQFYFESRHPIELRTPKDLIEARKMVKETNQSRDLIIWDGDPFFQPIYEGLVPLGKDQFIIITPKINPQLTGKHILTQIEITTDYKALDPIFETILNQPGKKSQIIQGTQKEFCRIKAPLLIKMSPLGSDIFIRLSETKFLKLFKMGDEFTTEDLEKYYIKKDVQFFYLKTADSIQILNKFILEIQNKQSAPGSKPNLGRTMEIGEAIHEATQEMIHKTGITPEISEIVRNQVSIAVREMIRTPSLKAALQQFQNDPAQYIAHHSIVLAVLSCSLASFMDWKSESSYQKLTFAAFLHDISLTNQVLARYSSLNQLEEREAGFSIEDLEMFSTHPAKGASLAQKVNGIPADVSTIILEHHELPDGTGFPRGLSAAEVTPLSTVFIIAHDLYRYLENNPDGDLKSFTKDRGAYFSAGRFKKVIKAIEEKSS